MGQKQSIELLVRGNTYYEHDDFDMAIHSYTEAIKINPTFALVYYYRARAFIMKGDLESAGRDYERAIELIL